MVRGNDHRGQLGAEPDHNRPAGGRNEAARERQRLAVANARNAQRAADKQRAKHPKRDKQPEAAAVAVSSKTTWSAPKIDYARDGSHCRITHRERIGTVLGSTAFTATAFSINPGLVTSFPWLSAIANRFESYSFGRLDFVFKTKTATTALGDVVLLADYDASESAPTSSIQAESYQSFTDGAPWQNLRMSANPKDLHKMKQRFNRDTTNPSGTDLKLYDVGTFYICTENQASAALVGYLYVEYVVDLFTPQLRSADFYISGGYVDALTATTSANPMGTSPVVDSDARGISVDAASVLTISNPGEYILAIQATGTVISALGATAVSGCTVTSRFGTTINGASTSANRCYKVVVSSFNATMTITSTATTITECQLDVASQPLNSFAFMLADVQHEGACPRGLFLRAYAEKGMKVPTADAKKLHCSCQTLVHQGKSHAAKEFVFL